MLGECPISTQNDYRGNRRSNRRIKPPIAASYVFSTPRVSILLVQYCAIYLHLSKYWFHTWRDCIPVIPQKNRERGQDATDNRCRTGEVSWWDLVRWPLLRKYESVLMRFTDSRQQQDVEFFPGSDPSHHQMVLRRHICFRVGIHCIVEYVRDRPIFSPVVLSSSLPPSVSFLFIVYPHA